MSEEGIDDEGGTYRPNDAFQQALAAKRQIEERMKRGGR
jgi:hypothetical protein